MNWKFWNRPRTYYRTLNPDGTFNPPLPPMKLGDSVTFTSNEFLEAEVERRKQGQRNNL